MGERRVSASDLVDWLRREMTAPSEPPAPQLPSVRSVDPLQLGTELAYLNHHWVLETGAAPSRRTPIGVLRRLAKRIAHRTFTSALSRYFLDEREFLANLVRLLNDLTKRVDELGAEIRLMSGGLQEVFRVSQEADSRMKDAVERRQRSLEERLASLETVVARRNR